MKNYEKITKEYIDDLLVRMTHNSTAIEGNTLTQAETLSVLLYDKIPREMNMREFYEVKNYKETVKYLFENNDELSLKKIKKYNSLIMKDIRDDNGSFKKINNVILGSMFETTPAYQVPYVLQEWIDNYNYRIKNAKNDDEKIEIIVDSHIKFEKIHPFSDGNGRTGRILMIDQCIKNNLDFFIIPVSEKDKYIRFLSEENVLKFTEWVKELQKLEKERITMFYNKEKGNIWNKTKKENEKER